MRCNECGYKNDENIEVCTKCGTKVTAAPPTPPPLPAQNPAPPTQADPAGGSPTVRGEISSQPSWDKPQEGGADFQRCPDCSHYPLQQPVSDRNPCPNCQSTGSRNSADGGRAGDSAPGKTARLENVNFGDAPEIVLTDIKSGSEHRFTGGQAELTRENLDPGNESISSRHATLSFRNGTWCLTDNSSNQATFIQVQGETPLNDKTRVVIGNRIYRVDFQ